MRREIPIRISYKLFFCILFFLIAFSVYINYLNKKIKNVEYLTHSSELESILENQGLESFAPTNNIIVGNKSYENQTQSHEMKSVSDTEELELPTTTKDNITETKRILENQGLEFSALVKDITEHLINLTNFQYTINNSVCSSYDKELLAIVIITSYAGNDKARATHRESISQSKLAELGFQRIFLIADLPATEHAIKQEQLFDEQQKFGDLLQGNFVDNYHNLSYKTIMGLRWAALECSRAKFIIKIDDDMVFDFFHIKNYLEALEVKGYDHNFLAGMIYAGTWPVRDVGSKYYVSKQEFAPDKFPDYLLGWYYITNPITAVRLVRESQKAQFLCLEDVWVTGVLRELIHVPLVRLAGITNKPEFFKCCVRDLKESNYECGFFVGPNGHNPKLNIEFLHNIEKCYTNQCVKRTPEQTVEKTCDLK